MTETEIDVPITCKFGGTSVAGSEQIRQVAAIVHADPRRRFIVVSAPGRRTPEDPKVTDLLYAWHDAVRSAHDTAHAFAPIRQRFEAIASELDITGADEALDAVEKQGAQGGTRDWVASRGEYLSARLIAEALQARFVDAADFIRFTPQGRLDPETYRLGAETLQGEGLFVIPGFYGRDSEGQIKTFSRGGSDVTGAIVARAVHASAYENWTDVDGLMMADPRIVDAPRSIREVTYQELRELAYMGASVLHDEAIFPVREASIPIHIRDTKAPHLPGTWIRASRPNSELPVVGIAGRPGFSAIQIDKALMNQELGFGRRFLEVLEQHGISYEHAPSSIDSMSVILEDQEWAGRETLVLNDLKQALQPDRMDVLTHLALIATVGQGMSHRVGIASRVLRAVADAGVNILMINQGASEINIILGVAEADYKTAINAIYRALVRDYSIE